MGYSNAKVALILIVYPKKEELKRIPCYLIRLGAPKKLGGLFKRAWSFCCGGGNGVVLCSI